MAENDKHADVSGEKAKFGWLDVLKRIKTQVEDDHIAITSAGIAFYFFLSFFPSLVAVISIYGLVNDPQQVEQQMSGLTAVLPEQTHQVISEQLKSIAKSSDKALGWSTALSILLSLWSANKGTKALFEGVNIAYNKEDQRNFFQENAITLLFTLGGMIGGILCMMLIIGFPALADKLSLPELIMTAIDWGRWLLLAIIVILALGLVYKFAPSDHDYTFKWISWGAVLATLLWMLGSWAFSFYIDNFGNFNETYGSAAAVVILMLWLNLTSFIILLGAEINAALKFKRAKNKDHPVSEEVAPDYLG